MIWVFEHIEEIFAVWGILVAVCTVVVKLTPSQKDDNVLAKIVKIADLFSVAFRKEDALALAKALKKGKK